MSNNASQEGIVDTEQIKVPMVLTLRDVVFVIVAVVSMAAAWGMFGTRLSVVEEKIISIGGDITDIRQMVKDLRAEEIVKHGDFTSDLHGLDERLRDIETTQAQLEVLLGKKK